MLGASCLSLAARRWQSLASADGEDAKPRECEADQADLAEPFARSRRGARRRAGRRRAGIDHHHARNALSAERRDGAARSRRRCGREGAVPATIAMIGGRIKVGLAGGRARPARRARRASSRHRAAILPPRSSPSKDAGHDGRRDDGDRRARRHRSFRDRRDRRRASRRGGDLRHLRRPDRACRERRSPSSAPAASRSSTSPRRWSFWRRRACRWSATAPTSSRPSSRARAATGSTTASTARPRSRGDPHGAEARVAERHPDRQSHSRGATRSTRRRSRRGSPLR